MGGLLAGSRMVAVYLNDHLAGATAGVELARRMAREYQDSDCGGELKDLAAEISLDRQALLRLMASLDVPARRYKIYGAWAGEKVGRLKPNGRVIRRSGLSMIVELEGMRLGVEGKALLWRTLLGWAPREPRLDTRRLQELLNGARQQTETLDALHTRAVQNFLTDRSG
ncbi:hypothetical protein AB0G35_15330 [Streptomyces sp. NPDC021749]|uniref:hypothetical protein n=1 Tax=Streptomyces sp. NPDC021749 TaxID=3154905 RepID=UPI0033DE32D7